MTSWFCEKGAGYGQLQKIYSFWLFTEDSHTACSKEVSKHSGISHRENRLWFLWPPGHNVEPFLYVFLFVFLWLWGWRLGPPTYKTSTLLLSYIPSPFIHPFKGILFDICGCFNIELATINTRAYTPTKLVQHMFSSKDTSHTAFLMLRDTRQHFILVSVGMLAMTSTKSTEMQKRQGSIKQTTRPASVRGKRRQRFALFHRNCEHTHWGKTLNRLASLRMWTWWEGCLKYNSDS